MTTHGEAPPGSIAEPRRENVVSYSPHTNEQLKAPPTPQLLAELASSADGLTQAEARSRLARDGRDEVEEQKQNPILKFFTYFWGPIPWMIEAAVALSAVVRHWLDFGIILLLLLSNAVVGFWEEHKAGNAIDVLNAKLAINARVMCDVKWQTPPESLPATRKAVRRGEMVPRPDTAGACTRKLAHVHRNRRVPPPRGEQLR